MPYAEAPESLAAAVVVAAASAAGAAAAAGVLASGWLAASGSFFEQAAVMRTAMDVADSIPTRLRNFMIRSLGRNVLRMMTTAYRGPAAAATSLVRVRA
jgi:hypothetical protein